MVEIGISLYWISASWLFIYRLFSERLLNKSDVYKRQDMELTVITLDEAPDILPCFEEDDACLNLIVSTST